MNARILVHGDGDLAAELELLVESRAGSVACFHDEDALRADVARSRPHVVVVGAAHAGFARALSRAFEGAPAAPRVVLVAADDAPSTDGDPLVVARRDCFATVGALLRFDPAHRVPVTVLARYEVRGAGSGKRLGNIVELGMTSLLFESEDVLPPTGVVCVSFVVPGSGERVKLTASLDPEPQRGGHRALLLDDVDPDARRALRAFIERRLVRTPAEVP